MFAAFQISDCLLNAIPKDFWLEQAEKATVFGGGTNHTKIKFIDESRINTWSDGWAYNPEMVYTTNYLSENPFCLRENSDLTLEDQYKRACVFAFRISESWSHRGF